MHTGYWWKETSRKTKNQWMDNIEINLEEVGWGGLDWIDVTQDFYECRAFVNMLMKLRVPYVWEILE
jgi:hypothetical protein